MKATYLKIENIGIINDVNLEINQPTKINDEIGVFVVEKVNLL